MINRTISCAVASVAALPMLAVGQIASYNVYGLVAPSAYVGAHIDVYYDFGIDPSTFTVEVTNLVHPTVDSLVTQFYQGRPFWTDGDHGGDVVGIGSTLASSNPSDWDVESELPTLLKEWGDPDPESGGRLLTV